MADIINFSKCIIPVYIYDNFIDNYRTHTHTHTKLTAYPTLPLLYIVVLERSIIPNHEYK